MADEPVFGVFKEIKGLFIGCEPYDKPTDVLPRHHGKQFMVSNTNAVTGNGSDAWFDKTMLLATPSTSYIEPLDLPTIVGSRAGPGAGLTPGPGPQLHDKPFRPTHPAAKSGRASGSPYGTFGPMSMFLVAPEGEGSKSSLRPITAPVNSLNNIYTSNPKRGGPGFPDQSRLLAGQPYTYVPDEYQRGRSLEKVLKQQARARIHKPFWGGARANGCFTPDSELYATAPNRPPVRSRSANTGLPAWRPNNPPAKGPYQTFSSPTYIPCPEPKEKPNLLLRPSTYCAANPTFVPTNAGHKRLSMWSVNPYERGRVQPAPQPVRGAGPPPAPPPPAAATAVK